MAGSVVLTIQVLRDGSRCSTSILWTMVQMMGKLKVVVSTRVCISSFQPSPHTERVHFMSNSFYNT